MGRMKEALDDADTWRPSPGKFASPECFGDAALRAVASANLSSRRCTYTGRVADEPIAAPLDVLVAHILESLQTIYDDAGNGVGWENGWVAAGTWDTWDLVEELVSFAEGNSEDLERDVVNALPTRDWSRIDPYGTRRRDIFSWSWRKLSEAVMHRRRYFFQQAFDDEGDHPDDISPVELLTDVAANARRAGLVRRLEPGIRLFRCRSRKRGERFASPRELGPPGPEQASQSRMSPAGIPMFYGAFEPATAQAETLDRPRRYALAEFRTRRPLRLLDLTTAPIVSVFDERRRTLVEWSLFMRAFLEDFRKPVSHRGAEHVEYVPTQVVTEFLRQDGARHGGLDGVIYRSVKLRGGTCVVLFAERDDVDPELWSKKRAGGHHLLSMRRVRNRRLERLPVEGDLKIGLGELDSLGRRRRGGSKRVRRADGDPQAPPSTSA